MTLVSIRSYITNRTLQGRCITLSIMALACYLSLWRIESLPSAIFSDEAIEGLDAQRILYQGARPVFLENNSGRQALFNYFVAGTIWLFGPTAPAIRLVSGLAVIGIVYGAMKTAEALFGQRIGWLTGLIAATTVLIIRIDRLGTRVSIFPMFLNLGVWQGILGVKTGRLRHWLTAGGLLGLAFYTYTPSLFIPIAIIAIVILSLLFHRAQVIRRWRGILLCNSVMFVVAAPLLIYFVQHPDASTERTSELTQQVLVQGPEKTRQFLIAQVGVMAGMFTVQGDDNIRHNIPGRPVFDAAMAWPFVIGLLFLLLRKKSFFLGVLGVTWLIIFLIPSYLTDGAPHFLRTTGMLAVVFIWPAIGLDAIRGGLTRTVGRQLGLIVASGALLASIHTTYHDYILSNFLASPPVFFAYDGEQTALVLHTNQLLNAGWTVDNIATKPLVPAPFTIWIQPGLWATGEVHTAFIAAANPDEHPYFKTLSVDSALVPPFALILGPTHQAEWLAKVPAGAPLSVEEIDASTKLFTIYRTSELLSRPYTLPNRAYRQLDAVIPGGLKWLSVEYPLSATPLTPFELTLHLSAPTPPAAADYSLRFDVLAPDGSLVSESQDLFDLPQPANFADMSFRQTVRTATPPGAYTLTVTLYNRATAQPDSFLDSNGRSIGATLTIGKFEVLRPKEPISLKRLADIRDQYAFGPLSLIGYSLDRTQARPGEQVFITFVFHDDQATSSDLAFNLFAPYLPTSQWQPGDVFRFVVPARVPAEAQGQYQFTLQLNQSPDRSYKLNPIQITPIDRVLTQPAADHPLTGVRFGGLVELSGYTLTTDAQGWAVDLVWRVLGTPTTDLKAFVHVEDGAGRIVTQSDAAPASGARPTASWLAGEYIVDPRHFAALPAGTYNLFAGLYDPVSGQRLGERLKIGTYTAP